jgi:hypothetical protein
VHALALGTREASTAQLADDGSVWIAPPGGELLTRLDSRRGTRVELQLDAPIARLVLVPEADRAVVVHAGAALELSVIEAGSPAADTIVHLEGLP